ncbi:MAG: hypothetical protein LAP13_16740 [Acidobacteriia bacterium]|nr:hypothetical protein [Terriglobia bacterium]
MQQAGEATASGEKLTSRSYLWLLVASFLSLYFELLVIRYLSTEVRVFAYIKNLLLIAAFFGLGSGMILGGATRRLTRAFPFLAAALFLLIAFAAPLHLTHLPFPMEDYFTFTTFRTRGVWQGLLGIEYVGAVLLILILVVLFFMVLGGLVGQELSHFPPLQGYSVNLVGSLGGILAFIALCYLGSPPAIWLLLGMLVGLPFIKSYPKAMLMFILITAASGLGLRHAIWSPYYRIDLIELPPPAGWNRPAAYLLTVNHDYHQKLVDLSSTFISRYADAEPNREAFSTYELPYMVVQNPKEVLVVGAGTGNDVAAALRHGAEHVDAVEIDPVIYRIGVDCHPEHPYTSQRVTMFIDDARAFFKRTQKRYDLIDFGYLDSQTLLTSFSSVRLDNYVYTVESFRDARDHLRPGGSLILAFASGKTFVTDRLFATLTQVFGVPPKVYLTGYDTGGVVFLEGVARDASVHLGFQDLSEELRRRSGQAVPATDNWPFLYLRDHRIPSAILLELLPFLWWCFITFKARVGWRSFRKPRHLHLFFLGGGFLLLETAGVTRLSLLFGSTWVVNAVVIASFIFMAFMANAFVMRRPVTQWRAYVGLFLSLGLSVLFPYHMLDGLAAVPKVLASAVLIGLPVFFSGLIFSRSFRDLGSPSDALGVNLIGAVIGGTLENLVMVGGTAILGILALALYFLSAATLGKGHS